MEDVDGRRRGQFRANSSSGDDGDGDRCAGAGDVGGGCDADAGAAPRRRSPGGRSPWRRATVGAVIAGYSHRGAFQRRWFRACCLSAAIITGDPLCGADSWGETIPLAPRLRGTLFAAPMTRGNPSACPRKICVLKIGDDELTKAVLQIFPLPRVDADAEKFLTIEECECLLENGDDLTTELEDLRRIPKEKEEVDKKSKENETKKVEMIWSKRISIGQRSVAF